MQWLEGLGDVGLLGGGARSPLALFYRWRLELSFPRRGGRLLVRVGFLKGLDRRGSAEGIEGGRAQRRLDLGLLGGRRVFGLDGDHGVGDCRDVALEGGRGGALDVGDKVLELLDLIHDGLEGGFGGLRTLVLNFALLLKQGYAGLGLYDGPVR